MKRIAFVFSLLFAEILTAGEPEKDLQDPPYKNEVSMTVENGVRTIRSNGIPDHPMGKFPNRFNPNKIAPQKYEYKTTAEPKAADKPIKLGMYPFGIAVNGVVFDPGAAEWFNRNPQSGWQYEPMAPGINLGVDKSHAHVQPNGAYHYHGVPTLLVERLTEGKTKMAIIGWAADGFPIYNDIGHEDPKNAGSPSKKLKSSYRVKKGTRPDGPKGAYDGTFVADYEYVEGAGDLDECNGRTEPTPEFPQGTYHYVLTDDFPYIPRQFHGTPDASFMRRGGAGGLGPRGPRPFGSPPFGRPPFGPPPPTLPQEK